MFLLSGHTQVKEVCWTSTVTVLTWTQNGMQVVKITLTENANFPSVGFEPMTMAVPAMSVPMP